MRAESMAFKQKKRVKNVRNRYLKPGALAQLRYSKTAARSCTDIRKKRVLLDSEKAELDLLDEAHMSVHTNEPLASPMMINFQPTTDGSKIETPKTPQSFEYDCQSRLESLPIDLLVKIMCHLHHDELRAVFHVSQRIRTAVILARQFHFNYTTPDRSRQEMLMAKTPLRKEHWPFISKGERNSLQVSSPQTPQAPRQGPRPPRLHLMDMKQIAAVLFHEPALPSSRFMTPPGLPRPALKPVGSTRVLFYEDELCQAVAQNKLR